MVRLRRQPLFSVQIAACKRKMIDATAKIHPSAIIDPSATLAAGVEVGPWTLIGPDVELGEGCVIASHVVIKGPTKIGKHNRIYQFSTVGEDTPDLKYKGEPTRLVIGDHNVIREGVTIHRGTIQDRHETTIGNHNLFMAYVHIGHDSVIGNHCILVNNTALAGHVHMGDWAILSGFTLVHQFCKIGAHSFSGMGSAIGKDVPAYVVVNGSPAEAKNINLEGLRRRGFTKEDLSALTKAYKTIYRRGFTVEEALVELKEQAKEFSCLHLLIDSLVSSTRGIVR
jgi:UDP-N-acetylglucosamine acyltransferase